MNERQQPSKAEPEADECGCWKSQGVGDRRRLVSEPRALRSRSQRARPRPKARHANPPSNPLRSALTLTSQPCTHHQTTHQGLTPRPALPSSSDSRLLAQPASACTNLSASPPISTMRGRARDGHPAPPWRGASSSSSRGSPSHGSSHGWRGGPGPARDAPISRAGLRQASGRVGRQLGEMEMLLSPSRGEGMGLAR